MRFVCPGFFRRLPALMLLLAAACTGAAHGQTLPHYAQPTVIPTGNWPAAVYTADINGDGFADLIYIDHGATPTASTTHVLLNDGQAHFTESAVLATAGTSVALGDLSGSGHVDIGWFTQTTDVGGVTNFLTIAAGNGTGQFNTFTVSTGVGQYGSTPFNFVSLVAGRLHDVGSLDVLAQEAGHPTLYDFHINAAHQLDTAAYVALPDGLGPAQVVDINRDGHGDVVVNGLGNSSVDIYLGTGIGLKSTSAPLPTPPDSRFSGNGGIHSAILQDVNGDGRPDLIAEGANGRIDVFAGNGDGTFGSASIGGTGTLDGTTGNGGHLIGLAQLASGQPVAFTATPAGISSLVGQNNAYFGLKGIYNAGPGHSAYAVADFNGDGVPDLAVDSPEGIAILFGNADGSFQTSQAYAAGQPALSVGLGAFTASGALDAVVSTAATQAQLLRGAGDGSFLYLGAPAAPVPTSSQPGPAGLWSRVAVADFNADGIPDIAMTADGSHAALPTTGTGLSVQLGQGDGTFGVLQPINVPPQYPNPNPTSCQPPFDHFPAQLYGTSVVADFNGDGIPDLANRDSGTYQILRGNTGTSTAATSFPTLYLTQGDGNGGPDCNLNAHQLTATGDFNNDGRADVFFQNNGSLVLYTTNAAGTLAPMGDLVVDGSLTTAGQLTAPDLSATFGGPSTALGGPYAIGSIAVADLDGDGNQDLIVLYHNLAADPANPVAATRNWLYVWYGSGNGHFLTSAAHPQNPVRLQPSRNFYQLAILNDPTLNAHPLLLMSDGYLLSLGTFGAEAHFLAGQGINGIATADLRKLGRQDIVVANGGLTLSNPVANGETLTPNPDVNTGGITVLLGAAASALPTTGTVTATPEPSYIGEPFTLTATLANGVTTPGTFTFSIDGTTIGSSTGNGVATLAGPTTLTLGSHAVLVTFTPTSNNTAIQFGTTHNVVLSPTTVVLTPTTPLTVYYGQAVDGTFVVQVLDANHPATGNYTLLDNGIAVPICTALPINAACLYGSPILLDAGPHAFSLQYLGDVFNAPSISASTLYTVLPDLTAATLAASPTTAIFGSNVALTATVTGNFAVPNGSVTFVDGTVPVGSAALNASGVAVINTSLLSVGVHTLHAAYPGTLDFNPVTSPTVAVTIIRAPATLATVLALNASLDPTAPGQPVTFTASVSVPGPFPLVATGNVTFAIDGIATGGSIPLNSVAQAALVNPTMAPGVHTVSASYAGATETGTGVPNGSLTLLPSSASISHTITYPQPNATPGFLMSISPVPAAIGVGRAANLIVTITPESGFAQTVQLTCSGLPTESACAFFGPTVPVGGGAIALQVATAGPHDCNDPGNPYSLGQNGPPTALRRSLPYTAPTVLAGLVLITFRRRRQPSRKLLARDAGTLLLLCTLGAMLLNTSGCGHCTDLGTRPGTYSFTVTAVAQGGPITETRSQTIPLQVTLP